MITRNGHKAIAKNCGTLASGIYVLESKPEKSPNREKQKLPAHLNGRRHLEEHGVRVRAGSLSDATGTSMKEARLIASRARSTQRPGDWPVLTRRTVPARTATLYASG